MSVGPAETGPVYNDLGVMEHDGRVWLGIGDSELGPAAWFSFLPCQASQICEAILDAADLGHAALGARGSSCQHEEAKT